MCLHRFDPGKCSYEELEREIKIKEDELNLLKEILTLRKAIDLTTEIKIEPIVVNILKSRG